MTPQIAALQASLFFTVFWGLLKFMSIESVMPSNHLILCHPLLPLPSILPSLRVFSNKSAFHIRWPKYWSFSFSLCRIIPWDSSHLLCILSALLLNLTALKQAHCAPSSTPCGLCRRDQLKVLPQRSTGCWLTRTMPFTGLE